MKTKIEIPKLKACPFCGGHAEFQQAETMDVGLSFPKWYVGCQDCGASGPCGGSLEQGKRKAAREWNRRM
jgi:Lar family restriction alleviation protein